MQSSICAQIHDSGMSPAEICQKAFDHLNGSLSQSVADRSLDFINILHLHPTVEGVYFHNEQPTPAL